jgi:hypothetical protein
MAYMTGSNSGLAIKYFFVDFVGGIVLFPVWWYTRGLRIVAARAVHSVSDASAWLGLGVWVKNLFVPMYGETSWQGKIISFFIRLFMIIVRGMGVLAWTVFAFAGLMVYVVILPFAVLGILYHVTGLLL